MRLVQIGRQNERRVGIVDGERLRVLDSRRGADIYSLAIVAAASGGSIKSAAQDFAGGESLNYDAIYDGRSEWRLLPAFDHPSDAAA